MLYSNFTLLTAQAAFELEVVDTAGLFSDVELVTPSELLNIYIRSKNTFSDCNQYRKGEA